MDETSHQKLSRLCSWCVSGNVAGAELELHEWCRRDDTPAAARVLLGSLLARRGMIEEALTILHRAAAAWQAPDSAQDRLLAAVLIDADLTDTARRVTTRMYHRAADAAAEAAWVRAMDAPGAAEMPGVLDSHAEKLAQELARLPGVIPSLVAAQRAHRDSRSLALLQSALARLALQTVDPTRMLTLCQAMADLSLLTGDQAGARRWAHRGLAINPYAASLALVLGALADDEEAGPPARDVLARAAEAYPQYPDLQAALIRRENAEGLADAAQRRVRAWLERQPGQSLALQVAKELAA